MPDQGITMEEAIETNAAVKRNIYNEKIKAAIGLGLEALKRERDRRPLGHPDPADLLPGEAQK